MLLVVLVLLLPLSLAAAEAVMKYRTTAADRQCTTVRVGYVMLTRDAVVQRLLPLAAHTGCMGAVALIY